MPVTTLKVPLATKLYRSVDGVDLKDVNVTHKNCYINSAGALVKRPAVGRVVSTPLEGMVFGLFYSPSLSDKFIGLMRATDKSGVYGVNIQVSNDTTGLMTWATFGNKYTCTDPFPCIASFCESVISGGTVNAFGAFGRKICYCDSNLAAFNQVGSNSPDYNHSVVSLDNYLIQGTKDTPTFFKWSDVNDALTWTTTNLASAMGRPDQLIRVDVLNRQLYIFGRDSIEIWEDDGVSPFSRITNGLVERGVRWPGDVCRVGDTFYFRCTYDRRFYRIKGTEFEVLECPFDKELAPFTAPLSGYMTSFIHDGETFLSYYLPSFGTYVYNTETDDWFKMSSYTGVNDAETSVPIIASEYAFHKRSFLVTYEEGNYLSCLVPTYYQDSYSPVGTKNFPVEVKTGHLDYGTSKLKRSKELRIRMKRGGSAVAGTAYITLLDDNTTTYGPYAIDLGATADPYCIFKLPRLGIFRTRQYTITAEGDFPFMLVDAEEDIEVLR
jgi:hypothetical protein